MQHPDEGLIHAWLDGELPEDQVNEISTHVSECSECSARVAEARGLVAASTRILTALDDVPGGVAPKESREVSKSAVPPFFPPSPDRHWYARTDIRAAAAVLLVAGASLILVKTRSFQPAGEMMTVAAERAQAASKGIADSNSPSPSAVEDQAAPTAATPQRTTRGNDATKSPGNRSSAIMGGIAQSDAKTESLDERHIAAEPSSSLRKRQAGGSAASGTMGRSPNTSAKDQVQGGMANKVDRLSTTVPAKTMEADAAAAPPPSANPGIIAMKSGVAGTTRSDASTPSVIEGRVIDRNTGKGVKSAELLVVGTQLRAYTDSSGNFTIANVPAGNRQLAIRRIGYAQQHIAIIIDQDSNVTANIALEPTSSELSEVVVTGAGITSNFATVSLRVVRVDTIADTRRTIYEISPGIRVTLTDSAPDAGTAKALDAAQTARRSMAATPRPANSPQEKPADTLKAEALAQSLARENKKLSLGAAVVMAAPPKVNVVSWTERGHRYVLSGPLTRTELEALKTRIMQLRR